MRFIIILSLITGCSFLIPKEMGKMKKASTPEEELPEGLEEELPEGLEEELPEGLEEELPEGLEEELPEGLEPVPAIPRDKEFTEKNTPKNTDIEKDIIKKVKILDDKLNIKIRKTCKDGIMHYIIRFQQGDRIETKCGTLWEC